MAKGRKLMISCGKRYLGNYSHNHSHETVTDTEDLYEDDVWSVVEDVVTSGGHHSIGGSQGTWHPCAATVSNGSMSIKSQDYIGRLSFVIEDSGDFASPKFVHKLRGQGSVANPCKHSKATSAPIDVPNWSKIYQVDSIESLHDSDDSTDDQDFEIVPPHEYLAREYRRIATNSVFEGIGRTLKGRDMSRVRDTVWNQTGFNG